MIYLGRVAARRRRAAPNRSDSSENETTGAVTEFGRWVGEEVRERGATRV
jgi:hypothetical protein